MRTSAIIALSCVLILVSGCVSGPVQKADSPTAIIGAMQSEVALIEGQLAERQEHRIQKMRFVTGKLHGRSVVVVRGGIGKVNAAMTATLLIDHFEPREVIFTGIAGGLNPDLQVGDILIAERTAQHDYGLIGAKGMRVGAPRNPITQKRNPLFYRAERRLVDLAERAAGEVKFETMTVGDKSRSSKVTKGVVVTGDTFIASEAKRKQLHADFKADATEMEGAAVAQVCHQLGTPCLVIRCLSDLAGAKASVEIGRFGKIAAANSARLVSQMVKEMAAEQSAGP